MCSTDDTATLVFFMGFIVSSYLPGRNLQLPAADYSDSFGNNYTENGECSVGPLVDAFNYYRTLNPFAVLMLYLKNDGMNKWIHTSGGLNGVVISWKFLQTNPFPNQQPLMIETRLTVYSNASLTHCGYFSQHSASVCYLRVRISKVPVSTVSNKNNHRANIPNTEKLDVSEQVKVKVTVQTISLFFPVIALS